MFMFKRKTQLVEINMPRCDDTVGNRFITSIALGVSRITEEDTWKGTRSKFMRSGGDNTRVTETTKYTKTVV